jgi:hypothetical protein
MAMPRFHQLIRAVARTNVFLIVVSCVVSPALSVLPVFVPLAEAAIAYGSVATTSTVGPAGPTLVINKPSSTVAGKCEGWPAMSEQ